MALCWRIRARQGAISSDSMKIERNLSAHDVLRGIAVNTLAAQQSLGSGGERMMVPVRTNGTPKSLSCLPRPCMGNSVAVNVWDLDRYQGIFAENVKEASYNSSYEPTQSRNK